MKILEREPIRKTLSEQILQIFENNEEPKTHKEICVELNRKDLSTVYGVLQRLVKKGILHKKYTEAGILYFKRKDNP